MPLHICNVLFSKQLSHRQWQFIFLCLLSFVEYPIQFVIMKCLSWLSGDSSLFHNDRGTWKMLLRLTRGIHRQCFNLHVMSRADLLSTSLPSRPSVVRKAFSGMAVRCICGPSGRGNALGQLYIPWPQAAFVDWFSYTMHNLHNWTSLHMEPTDHKWAFFFSPLKLHPLRAHVLRALLLDLMPVVCFCLVCMSLQYILGVCVCVPSYKMSNGMSSELEILFRHIQGLSVGRATVTFL